MRGIKIAVAPEVMFFTFRTFAVFARHFRQIMLITAFAMDQFAQQPFACQIQAEQFITSVTAIFQHHAGNAGRFRRPNQMPQLIQRRSTADFDTGIFAQLHCIFSDMQMAVPGGRNQYCINLIGFKQLFVIFKNHRLRIFTVFHDFLNPDDTLRIDVTNRSDQHLFAIHFKNRRQQRFRTCAQTDNTDIDSFFHNLILYRVIKTTFLPKKCSVYYTPAPGFFQLNGIFFSEFIQIFPGTAGEIPYPDSGLAPPAAIHLPDNWIVPAAKKPGWYHSDTCISPAMSGSPAHNFHCRDQ